MLKISEKAVTMNRDDDRDLDLSSCSLDELLRLRQHVDGAIKEALAREVPASRDVAAMLAPFGLTLEDLGARRRSVMAGKKLPPKYRDPANEANTWTGRGSQPRWFREALAAGTPVEVMIIQQE